MLPLLQSMDITQVSTNDNIAIKHAKDACPLPHIKGKLQKYLPLEVLEISA